MSHFTVASVMITEKINEKISVKKDSIVFMNIKVKIRLPLIITDN